MTDFNLFTVQSLQNSVITLNCNAYQNESASVRSIG